MLAGTGPLTQTGNTFSYNFELETYTGICPDDAWYEYQNVVLGVLTPGTYTLITTAWNVPVHTNYFLIPASTPVLQPIGFNTNGCFEIKMSNGAINQNYVLQGSSNLVNWTSLSTNTVSTNSDSLILTNNPPVLSRLHFFRVLDQ